MISQDDVNYEEGQVPDIGSITPIKNENGIREYVFLSSDFDKLQSIVTYCKTGSVAFACDTSDVYTFHSDTKQWYPVE